MKHFARVLLFLFLLVSVSVAARSQSGRNQQRDQRTSDATDTAKSTDATDTAKSTNAASDASAQNDSSAGRKTSAPQDAQGETMDGDVIRIDTTLVTVPVSVSDSRGRFIPNLRKQDFRIFENGVEQQVAYFATVDQPFTVVLMIDTSRSTNFRLEDIQSAAIAFIDQLRPADRVMVISFDDRIKVLAEPTNDREQLTSAIRRTRTGGGTRLYDAVDFVINQRLNRIKGRKAVVLFTDGVDTTSRRANYESTIHDAEELDALIYPVDYDTYADGGVATGGGAPQSQTWPFPRGRRGGIIFGSPFPRGGGWPGGGGGRGGGWPGGGRRGTSSDDYRLADAYLHDLAQKTGARYYSGDTLQNISEAFAQVAEELRCQYSLGYYPKQAAQTEQRRQIKVRVNQPGLVVRARDSYIYSQKRPDSSASDAPPTSPNASPGRHLSRER